jgi:hypothetical protein
MHRKLRQNLKLQIKNDQSENSSLSPYQALLTRQILYFFKFFDILSDWGKSPLLDDLESLNQAIFSSSGKIAKNFPKKCKIW